MDLVEGKYDQVIGGSSIRMVLVEGFLVNVPMMDLSSELSLNLESRKADGVNEH
jgi:hypothetical protein